MQEFLTVPEVAQRLRVKATTVRQWIQSGVLEAETIQQGKRYRIKRSVIDIIVTEYSLSRLFSSSDPHV